MTATRMMLLILLLLLLVFVLGLLCDTVATDIIVDKSPMRYGAVAIVFWGKAG